MSAETVETAWPDDSEVMSCDRCGRSWDRKFLGEDCTTCGQSGRYTFRVWPGIKDEVIDWPAPQPHSESPLRFAEGGTFILDTSPDPEPIWGSGQAVLWAEGEALTIVGGQGVGKTTLAQQLALGRCGFPAYSEVLGYPVKWERLGTVLYMAMDRPRQAARSFRRMVTETMRDDLDRVLRVWEGPPLGDIAKTPEILLGYAQAANADTIIVDSLKDAALALSDDEVGGGWNRARQIALRAGVQVLEVHHNRKSSAGAKESPTIDAVYGSTWITSGSGSVLLLAGSPGDPIVNLHHLKQPAEEVGPLRVIHDHDTGRSSVWHSVDLLAACHTRPEGLTALDAARRLFDVDKPSASQKEKARRKLDRMAKEGLVHVLDEGDAASKRAKRWGR